MAQHQVNVAILAKQTGIDENQTGYIATPFNPLHLNEMRPYLDNLYNVSKQGPNYRNDSVLDIIVLPEFFFQSQIGYYTEQEKNVIEQHLANYLQQKNDKKTLFVFGTIVYQEGNSFANVLLYGKTGTNVLMRSAKQNLSRIDLIQCDQIQNNIGLSAGILKRSVGQNALNWHQPNDANNHTYTFNNIARIKIGFSVCLDYDRNVLGARLQQIEEPNSIKLHIVSSCGIAFKENQRGVYNKNSKVIICDAMVQQGNKNSRVVTVDALGVGSATSNINIDNSIPDFTIRKANFVVTDDN